MVRIDYKWVRAQFPTLEEPNENGFSFFDNAGGTFPCRQSNYILFKFYNDYKMQPYGATKNQAEAGRLMDEGRRKIAELLGLKISDLTYGASTTQNFNTLAISLLGHIEQDDEIIVTMQDHEANIGAWERLAKQKDAKLILIEVELDGELDLSHFKSCLSHKTKIVSFTHSSNIIGTVNDVNKIGKMIKEQCPHEPLVIVDGVSYAPHMLPDITALDVDAYCFSTYKTFGVHMGLMFTSEKINRLATPQCHFFNIDKPNYSIFDAAGPDHASIASLAGIADYYQEFAIHHGMNDNGDLNDARKYASEIMHEAETELLKDLLALIRRKNVRVYGKERVEGREANISFTVYGMDSKDVIEALAQKNIGAKYGHFYAYRLLEALGIKDLEDGVVRISYAHYLNKADNERLLGVLSDILPNTKSLALV